MHTDEFLWQILSLLAKFSILGSEKIFYVHALEFAYEIHSVREMRNTKDAKWEIKYKTI